MTIAYDADFYNSQMAGSLRSARVFTRVLSPHLKPKSVADLGCGRGTWLQAFKEAGASRLVGLDGPWNSQRDMVDESIEFHQKDLDRFIDFPERFDLAMSVEVAEHLRPQSAPDFVKSLVSLSDTVLFSAAFIGQGGRNHINEQLHSYWASLFAELGYRAFDIFRPKIWGDARVEYWYRRNAFLYLSESSPIYRSVSRRVTPVQDLSIMDCVEPNQYLLRLKKRQIVGLLPRIARLAVQKAMRPGA